MIRGYMKHNNLNTENKPMDYNVRAARGQAYNLAVLTSIADGKHQDKNYVIEQYLKHLTFAQSLQELNEEDLKKFIGK